MKTKPKDKPVKQTLDNKRLIYKQGIECTSVLGIEDEPKTFISWSHIDSVIQKNQEEVKKKK